jgi:hypothetical protein
VLPVCDGGQALLAARASATGPVKTVMMVQGNSVTTEVIEAGRQTFPDSLFVVPAGFTKQDIMGLMGGRGTQR